MTLQTGKLKINGVDIATEVNQKVNSSALAKVATSGSYNDLKDKPSNFSVFKGATSSTNGTSGLVPQPNKGDNQKWLSGDGTWKLGTQLEVTVEKISKTATSPQSYSLGNNYTAIIVFVNSVLAVDGDSYGIVGTNKLVFNDILPVGTEVVIYKFITLGSVLPSSNIAVDSALSATSTATVQNKAIYNAMQLKADKSALTAMTEFMNSYQSQLDAIYAKYEAELS